MGRLIADNPVCRAGRSLPNKEVDEMTKTVAEIGTVSFGTHRPQDLIPRFERFLEGLDDEQICRVPHQAQVDDDDPWWDTDEPHGLLVELMDALYDHAPAGAYFGAIDGDGADYGFWWDDTLERDCDGRPMRCVSVYAVSRRYGGPQEGGWWWNRSDLVLALPLLKHGDRDEIDMLRRLLMERYTGEGDIYSVAGGVEYHVIAEWRIGENEVLTSGGYR